jgi:catechol 2,3-dioxygenase-like lactoylglutathione lyase family enzyme
VLDHLGLQCADVEASLAFYVTTFAPLGLHEAMRFDTPEGPVVGIAAADGFPHFWLSPAPAGTRHEAHVAFAAPDREAVDAVHRAALDAGHEVLHSPRVWPEYHPGYYGTFVRDLDGNNVEAVHHTFG